MYLYESVTFRFALQNDNLVEILNNEIRTEWKRGVISK